MVGDPGCGEHRRPDVSAVDALVLSHASSGRLGRSGDRGGAACADLSLERPLSVDRLWIVRGAPGFDGSSSAADSGTGCGRLLRGRRLSDLRRGLSVHAAAECPHGAVGGPHRSAGGRSGGRSLSGRRSDLAGGPDVLSHDALHRGDRAGVGVVLPLCPPGRIVAALHQLGDSGVDDG